MVCWVLPWFYSDLQWFDFVFAKMPHGFTRIYHGLTGIYHGFAMVLPPGVYNCFAKFLHLPWCSIVLRWFTLSLLGFKIYWDLPYLVDSGGFPSNFIFSFPSNFLFFPISKTSRINKIEYCSDFITRCASKTYHRLPIQELHEKIEQDNIFTNRTHPWIFYRTMVNPGKTMVNLTETIV